MVLLYEGGLPRPFDRELNKMILGRIDDLLVEIGVERNCCDGREQLGYRGDKNVPVSYGSRPVPSMSCSPTSSCQA